MDREKLKDILLSQGRAPPEKKVVKRKMLDRIREVSATPFVIIISGVRRCGKSTVLRALRNDDCYYVNFDDERLISFTVDDFQVLVEILAELFGPKNTFIFDEIQNIRGWERFARRLYDETKKLYVTGSNASMLSRELGTHLTGRNISLSLFPFSFSEFLDFKEADKNASDITPAQRSALKRLFNEYLLDGGFPEYLQTKKEEYLRSLYENILYRDIIVRYNLPAEKPLKETVYYLASNIGKETSFNTIKTLAGLSSATTIREYLEYLENSYFAFVVPRYDPSLKKQIYSPKKVFFIDTCLVRILGFRPSEDAGRLMENLVFLALRRKYQEIYYHKGTQECDFLVRDRGRIVLAFQVTTALKESNREREIAGLLEALKQYKLEEGTIITEDQSEEILVGGKKIRVISAWKWLLEFGD